MKGVKFVLILAFVGALQLCAASKILVVFPMPARSHFNLGEKLAQELLNRGHEVTVFAPYKMPKPHKNLTEITIPDFSKELMSHFDDRQSDEGKFAMRDMSPFSFIMFYKMGGALMNMTLSSKPAQSLIKSNEKFDLVLGECFLTEAALGGFSNKFKAPIIALATFMPNVWVNELVGNPAPTAYVPEPILSYTDRMTFMERFTNFFYSKFARISYYLNHLPAQDEVMREYFGKDSPPLKDTMLKTSLVLVNHHFSLAFPRPYLPNIVEIGGYHVRPAKPLPQDLQKFMDDAKDGVIFFSMGSNLQSADFPKRKFEGIIRALSKLKQRVLWKFEIEDTKNLPQNIKISKWMPQSDILAHPNLKLFITHGGLLSMTESVYRGVPIVGIPIFGDQPLNMRYAEQYGFGVHLGYDDLDEVNLLQAINKVLNNPKYKNNAMKRSVMLRDVPVPQMENAMFWIEYVIRYKGASHLRSGVQDLTWYQAELLDVFATIGAALTVVALVMVSLVKCVCRTLCGGEKKKSEKASSSKKRN